MVRCRQFGRTRRNFEEQKMSTPDVIDEDPPLEKVDAPLTKEDYLSMYPDV